MAVLRYCRRAVPNPWAAGSSALGRERPPRVEDKIKIIGVCSPRSGQRGRAAAPAAPVPAAAADAELATRPSPGKVAACERERASRENHYTLHEDAVYAELDRDSTAFHNGAYTGSDTEPSSAYYSDLSAADRDRPYEAVAWEGQPSRPALSAITETLTVPSDYV